MASYGNPHTLSPTTCSTNTFTFTDPSLTTVTKPRTVHINELRTAIDTELSRRGLSTTTWTDSTLTANSTLIRKTHVDELRTALIKVHTGDCSDAYYCPQDALSCADFTDSTINANSTFVRNLHVTQLRTAINTLRTSCICEAEQCQYCADCGYYYQYCNHNGIVCDDSQSGESCGYYYASGACASYNVGGSHPYTSATGSPPGGEGCSYSTVAWNNTVPWNMCNYAPPGNNWTVYWTCKCNPFAKYTDFCTPHFVR